MKRSLLYLTLSLISSLPLHAETKNTQAPETLSESSQSLVAKDYSSLMGMPGFSDKALKMHLQLYQGYVKNANMMLDLLKGYAANGEDRSIPYAEVKRRLMWEYDGMRLHEFYFDNLGGKGTALEKQSALYQKIVKDFGSYDAWRRDFIATGAMRGIGWAVLYLDPLKGTLLNLWINEHDLGHLAGGNPLLIMDVFEHAYLPDYGLDRMAYIEAFFNNIHWEKVSGRYQRAVKNSSN